MAKKHYPADTVYICPNSVGHQLSSSHYGAHIIITNTEGVHPTKVFDDARHVYFSTKGQEATVATYAEVLAAKAAGVAILRGWDFS